MRLSLLWFLVMCLEPVCCARILAILPLAAKSHHAFFQPILKTLAHRGHNVTVYSPFRQQKTVPNYTDILLETPLIDVKNLNRVFWDFVHSSQLALDITIWDIIYPTCVETFKQEPIVRLMESSETFDLVFTQALVGQEVLLAFAHKFQAPTIALQPKGACTVDNRVAGNSLSISYIPDIGLPYSNSMSFFERFFNAYSKLLVLYHYYFHHIPKQEALLKKHFKGHTMPPLIHMVQNISMIFTLGHSTAAYAQPSTPNIIALGGIHIDHERKPLPKDIKKFMDEARDGVIYFSLGTYVPDDLMGKEYFQNYINAFRRLPQRVLWKTRMEDVTGLPPNVMIGKWMPQQDILAHPKCVLFITHGGLLSQHEAIHFGVPVVGVPYFADQPMNVRVYEELGQGVMLDFKTLNHYNIYESITKVVGDPRFKENAMRLSKIFKDRPLSPEDSVVFWTEYVLRHRGAGHLRPASAQLPFYQLTLLDVLAVILVTILLMLFTFYFIIRSIYLYCITSRKQMYKQKKSKIS